MNWVTTFSPIFLRGRLSDLFYEEWVSFAKAMTLMRSWDLSDNDINTIERLTIRFVEHYEAEYYQYEDKRLSACKATFHYLLHIAQSIRDCGPPGIFWQFPMERQCGFLAQAVKSRASANRNLSLSILYSTQLHFLATAYPKLEFTELVVDREDKTELQTITSAVGKEVLPEINPDEVTPNRVLTVNYYAGLGTALSHFHKNGPQCNRPLTKGEYGALQTMLKNHYGQAQQLQSLQELTVTKFSNCWKGYEKLGSHIALTSAVTGRNSSVICYVTKADAVTSYYGRVNFYAYTKIRDIDWLVAFVDRFQIGRIRGHQTLFVVEQPSTRRVIDCISVENIVCSIGLLPSSSRKWLCTRTSSLFE